MIPEEGATVDRPAAPPCAQCQGEGEISLTACPHTYIPCDVTAACRLVDDADDFHVPPVLGGTLDQTRAFLRARRLLRNEENKWANHQREQRKR